MKTRTVTISETSAGWVSDEGPGEAIYATANEALRSVKESDKFTSVATGETTVSVVNWNIKTRIGRFVVRSLSGE
jgi:D-tyrosyl-tRNA(Tyr) deacylase